MTGLKGKIAIVTGAARGIGKDVSKRFMAEGACVVLADMNPLVVETAEELKKKVEGGKCTGIVTDVSSSKDVGSLMQYTINVFGGVDILVNNAGINQKMMPLAETDDTVFDKIINVNFRGVFNCSRAATKQMIKQGRGGFIVNIASYYGKRGYAYFAVYCASKAAVINFTQAHALEAIKHNIHVNCICPGNMMTEMHAQSLREEAELKKLTFEEIREIYKNNIPVQRHGSGDDIAGAVVFLCSDDGSYTIGEALNVSGGLEMN